MSGMVDVFFFFKIGRHSHGKKCAPLFADLFLHSYEAYFIADLIQKKEHCLVKSFKLNFRYIDDVLMSECVVCLFVVSVHVFKFT